MASQKRRTANKKKKKKIKNIVHLYSAGTVLRAVCCVLVPSRTLVKRYFYYAYPTDKEIRGSEGFHSLPGSHN